MAGFAINEMRLTLEVAGFSAIEVPVLVLFTLNILWISLPFLAAMVGLVRLFVPRARRQADSPPLSSRTAVLMPTYNEDPAHVAAALDAMAHDLIAQGEGRSFDLFLLSDTTHGDVALAEHEVVWTLRQRLGERIRVYYRRRPKNTGHKPGNIHDFCERWGSSYDHLLVLDADSLMEGATMVRLARRMESDPDAGTHPDPAAPPQGCDPLCPRAAVRRQCLRARAERRPRLVDGNGGHLLGPQCHPPHRRPSWPRPGCRCCPECPPLGGNILSHDFVEAALLRRAGWSVSIADDLEGTYEECPPSLIDVAVRDRRWCQGNLQHLRVLGAKGLHWVSRLHFLAGILTYLASPLWLLFVLSGLALGVQYKFSQQQYFLHASTLFPLWPRIDPVRAARLFGVTLGILLGPKVLGMLSVLLSPSRLRAAGGLVRFALGFILEVAVSALIAPIQAMSHCGILSDVVRGQRRRLATATSSRTTARLGRMYSIATGGTCSQGWPWASRRAPYPGRCLPGSLPPSREWFSPLSSPK